MNELSVVLITKNQAWNVKRLVESVLRETSSIDGCQIIVVDSASADGTVERACEYPIDVVQLQPGQRLTAAAGRYVGQKHTTGELVLFLDGDMEMCVGWLAPAMKLLRESEDVTAVTGALINVFPDGGSEVRDELGSPETQREVRSCGGAGLFRRSVLEEVGTFNPFLFSEEEPELCLRIRFAGYRVIQLGHRIAKHYSPSDVKLATLFGRWNRGLYVGFGQVVRYQMRTKMLWTYICERGFVVAPGFILIAGVVCGIALLLGHGGVWFAVWCGLLTCFVGYTMVRKRSLQRTVASLVNRILSVVGTISGLMLEPILPESYHAKLCVMRSTEDRIRS